MFVNEERRGHDVAQLYPYYMKQTGTGTFHQEVLGSSARIEAESFRVVVNLRRKRTDRMILRLQQSQKQMSEGVRIFLLLRESVEDR